MECWDKMIFSMQRVWIGVAARFGVRKSPGILKLSNDVMSCEYEDVHVMWEMLKRNETPTKRKKKPSWNNVSQWATRAPYLCRSF